MRHLLHIVVGTALFCTAAAASAGGRIAFSVTFGSPGFVHHAPPPVVYYAPPAVVYYAPPPVVYYRAAPAVIAYPVPGLRHHGHRHHFHGRAIGYPGRSASSVPHRFGSAGMHSFGHRPRGAHDRRW